MTKIPIISLCLALVCLHASALTPKVKELPYANGVSEHRIEGLQVHLHVPKSLDAKKPCSLVVLLHGAGGRAQRLMTCLRDWVPQNYLVCAPQATASVWQPTDLDRVEAIAEHIKKVMPVHAERVHVMGFCNGAWNLPRLAFSKKLKPASAVFIGAGFRGGRPPKWAKKTLGVLAVAGEQDQNATSTLRVPDQLQKKVRHVSARLQPNLGHQWPLEMNPYIRWWMGAQENRFSYGESRVLDWKPSKDALKSLDKQESAGILVFCYDSTKPNDSEAAAMIVNRVLIDREIQALTRRVVATRWDLSKGDAPFGKVRKAPGLAILSNKGKLKKYLSGKVTVKALRTQLKAISR